jgi:photosystem II stability/assembly factor-like uncharacterized protein
MAALAAVVVIAIAGLMIVHIGSGGSAQARQDPPQVVAEGGPPGEHRWVSERDVIREADLVRPREGWALTSSRLAWTTDGGASWSTITPPGLGFRTILAARFDRSGHGVVVASRRTNGHRVPLEFFSTTDDGRTWHVSSLEGGRPGSIGSVRASESDGNWWVLVDESGIDPAGTRLYESEDAGRSWKARPRPPASGQFTFLSQDEGWIVGGAGRQLIYRTEDGGASWEAPGVPLPGPMEPGEEVPAQRRIIPTVPRNSQKELEEMEGEPVPLPGEGNRRVVEYGLPERGPGGVLLPVTITTPEGWSVVLLYDLSDGGAPKQVSETKLARRAGESEATTTFVAPGELLIQDQAAGSGPPTLIKVSIRSGGSGHSHRGARTTKIGHASGLPEALPLQFVDRLHGVAVQREFEVIGANGGPEGTQLFLTTDGGRHWSPSRSRP